MKKITLIFSLILPFVFTTAIAQDNEERISIFQDELPQSVRTALNNDYANWDFVTAYKVTSTGTQSYDDPGENNNNNDIQGQNNDDYQSWDTLGSTENDENMPAGMPGQQQQSGEVKQKKPQTNNRNDNRPDNPSYESTNGTANKGTAQQNNTGTQTQNTDTWGEGTYSQNGGTVAAGEQYYEVLISDGAQTKTVRYDENGNEL